MRGTGHRAATAYLLTGAPGAGKTTVIKRALDSVELSAGGFYTEEIRGKGARQGFRLVTLDGEAAILAHVDIRGRQRVSRYGVDVEAVDRVGAGAIGSALRQRDVVVIDEIGKMELCSERFRDAVLEAIASGRKVLGTIMQAHHPWADEIKGRDGVNIVTLTRSNHEEVLADVLRWLAGETEE